MTRSPQHPGSTDEAGDGAVRRTTLERIVAAIEGPDFEYGVIPSAMYQRLVPVCAEIEAELSGRHKPEAWNRATDAG
ncbi:hypothetical protein [Agromyces subbeticus]|uniref:hypothetical protein n=1 Tax=Agromyces subbeticus TaxID=293890 RepID=UPI0003B39132|nr:hypothetical protein [Agromyces subbeticus]